MDIHRHARGCSVVLEFTTQKISNPVITENATRTPQVAPPSLPHLLPLLLPAGFAAVVLPEHPSLGRCHCSSPPPSSSRLCNARAWPRRRGCCCLGVWISPKGRFVSDFVGRVGWEEGRGVGGEKISVKKSVYCFIRYPHRCLHCRMGGGNGAKSAKVKAHLQLLHCSELLFSPHPLVPSG